MLALPAGKPAEPEKPTRIVCPMGDAEYDLLLQVLNVQSYTGATRLMHDFLKRTVTTFGATWTEEDGNLYVTKGKSDVYPCYVAHTDTIHDLIPQDAYTLYYYQDEPDHPLFAWNEAEDAPHGIGGDDKCGVFLCLVMLRDLDACKVAFFRDEERGCIGSNLARMEWFSDVGFAFQADRRGNSDLIRNSSGTELYGGDEFLPIINGMMGKYGYHNAYGTVTDVRTLKEKGLAVCAFNISAGYFNPHSDEEYVVPDDLWRTVCFVKELTEKLAGRAWPHVYQRPVYTPGEWKKKDNTLGTYAKGFYQNSYWDEFWGRRSDEEDQSPWADEATDCPDCGRSIPNRIGWCNHCQQFILVTKAGRVIRYTDDDVDLDLDTPPVRVLKQCPTCQRWDTEYDEDNGWEWCFSCSQWFDPGTGAVHEGWDENGEILELPPDIRERTEDDEDAESEAARHYAD